ncbi:MAG: hypothetical protein VZR00_07525 [Lachnospiraceae bacterium]|nr:hypothetical protein [Lachnospiraceae bacterium]
MNQVDKLIRSGKYIPGLFVELSDVKECLRYFIYGKKWKSRIIKAFNFIYDNVYGEILRKGYKENNSGYHVGHKLPPYTSIDKLQKAINTAYHFHSDFEIRGNKFQFSSAYEDSKPLFEIIRSPYQYTLEALRKKASCINQRYIVLTGGAGNGKTNLLCSMVQLLNNLKQPVLFLNARDIAGELPDYIGKELRIPEFLGKHQGFFWHLENFKCKLSGKHFFLILDAVNENEEKGFCKALSVYLNKMLRYSRVKVLVSCRSEYFEARFRKPLIDDIHFPVQEVKLDNDEYDETALERLYRVYSDHFHFTGKISIPVKEALNRQLLLIRIFFEVFQGQAVNVTSIRTHELFKTYIDSISDEGFDVDSVLQTVSEIMLTKKKYAYVNVEELEREINRRTLSRALDGSILLEKEVQENEGTIAEDVRETVCFTFDELRDYSLARCLAKKYTVKGLVDEDAVISELQKLEISGAPSAEGVIHYMYVYLRDMMDKTPNDYNNACRRILKLYTITDINQKAHYYGIRESSAIQNQGVKIILTSGFNINSVEVDFLRDCLIKNAWEDGGAIFAACLRGSIYHSNVTLNQYIDIVTGIRDGNAISRVLRAAMTFDMDMPIGLIKIHKYHADDSVAALQIQKIAELFLLAFTFKDEEIQNQLEGYFYRLPNHKNIQIDLKNQLIQSVSKW